MAENIFLGDSLEVLKTFAADSIDACVTDPPSGIGILNKKWDSYEAQEGADSEGLTELASSRKPFVDFITQVFLEVYRVLKPGAYGLVWALPRTSSWTATGLENAGFDVKDVITHLFASGWPKHKTSLKPSNEHWILIQKPFQGSLAQNLEKYGVGALQIDACRVGNTPGARGRWPSNTALSHDEGCRLLGTKRIEGQKTVARPPDKVSPTGWGHKRQGGLVQHASDDSGMETVEEWDCAPGCPVGNLEEQEPGASRFFPQFQFDPFVYQAKATTEEKQAGVHSLFWKRTETGHEAVSFVEWAQLAEDERLLAKDGKPASIKAQGNVHPCLCPGSLVLSAQGWVAIESVLRGDLVVGADGALHPVTDVSSHPYNGAVYRVHVEGRSVDATDNHPFLILRGNVVAWVKAECLLPGDCTLTPENALSTAKPWENVGQKVNTPVVQGTPPLRGTIESGTTDALECSTTLPGSKQADPSRWGSTSTTRTKTSRTIACQTLNWLTPLHTRGFTLVANSVTESGGSHAGCAVCSSPLPPSTGTSASKAGYATGADPAISASLYEQSSFAVHPIERIEHVPYNGDVWNLTVPDVPTFQTVVGMTHNTTKSLALMGFLTRCVTPPGGTVLDCFMGSGTTGAACVLEGLSFIGIEKEPVYYTIAEARISYTRVRFDIQKKLPKQQALPLETVSKPVPQALPVPKLETPVPGMTLSAERLAKLVKRASKPRR